MRQRDIRKSRRPLDLTAAERSARYRNRKLNRQRIAVDSLFFGQAETLCRRELENFYLASGLRLHWTLASELFAKVRSLLLDPDSAAFLEIIKRIPGIETAHLHLGGESVLLIRPRYFLKGGKTND